MCLRLFCAAACIYHLLREQTRVDDTLLKLACQSTPTWRHCFPMGVRVQRGAEVKCHDEFATATYAVRPRRAAES